MSPQYEDMSPQAAVGPGVMSPHMQWKALQMGQRATKA